VETMRIDGNWWDLEGKNRKEWAKMDDEKEA
jgi:hypothetical protein